MAIKKSRHFFSVLMFFSSRSDGCKHKTDEYVPERGWGGGGGAGGGVYGLVITKFSDMGRFT